MAYKFQLGDSVMSGTLTQEGDLIVQNGGDSALGFFSSSAGLKLSNTGVVSAPSQGLSLNIADMLQIDGITAGTVAASKAVVVSSDKDAAGFRNIGAAQLSASGDLQIAGGIVIDGGAATISHADLLAIDGITPGTIAAGKAVVVDSNKDAAAFRNVNMATLSASAGLTIAGAATIVAPGVSLNVADLLQVDGITAGTAAANKALVVDGNKDIATLRNVNLATLSASAGMTIAGAGTIVAPGVSLNVADLLQIDGITAGTVAASKAVVVSADKDATGFRDISGRNLSGSGELQLGVGGDVNIAGSNVLNLTALGSTVLASSLTSVGTIVGMTASGPSQFQILKTTGLLSGSTADVGGQLRAGLGNFVVDADGDVSAKSLLSNSTVSGSGNATFAGKIEGNGGFELFGIALDANYAQAEDGVYYRDATTGEMKASTNDAFLTAIAGAGITVSGNKLVADAGAAPVGRGDASVQLTEAFNFGTTELTANRNWTLPAAPTNGDIVRIKAPSSMGAGSDSFTINVTGSGAQVIEGQGGVLLESAGAAISVIYAGGNNWLLF